MELSRERCGKQCTKWRRQAWRRRRQGERGGRGRTVGRRRCCFRRAASVRGLGGALCCQALGGAERGGQHPGLRHPVAIPGARSLAPSPSSLGLPRLGGCYAGPSPLSGRLSLPLSLSRPGGRCPARRPAALAGAFISPGPVLTTRGKGHRIDEFTRSLLVGCWAGAAASVPFRGPGRVP